MDDTSPAADAARTEAAKQAVILAFGVASLLAYMWVQRWASNPDVARSGRMRVARSAERAWARVAGWAWRQAEKARLAYEKDRA